MMIHSNQPNSPSFNISQRGKTVHGEVKTWCMKMRIKNLTQCLFSPPAMTLFSIIKEIRINSPPVLHAWGIRAKLLGYSTKYWNVRNCVTNSPPDHSIVIRQILEAANLSKYAIPWVNQNRRYPRIWVLLMLRVGSWHTTPPLVILQSRMKQHVHWQFTVY